MACFAASGIGQVLWCYLELSTGRTPGTETVAAVGYLVAPVFAVVALLWYWAETAPGRPGCGRPWTDW